jgi:hypothetical protein
METYENVGMMSAQSSDGIKMQKEPWFLTISQNNGSGISNHLLHISWECENKIQFTYDPKVNFFSYLQLSTFLMIHRIIVDNASYSFVFLSHFMQYYTTREITNSFC